MEDFEFVEAIRSIEESVDIDRYDFKPAHGWPIIRLVLRLGAYKKNFDSVPKGIRVQAKKPLSPALNRRDPLTPVEHGALDGLFLSERARAINLTPDILFLCQAQLHSDKHDSLDYASIFDSFCDLAPQEISVQKLIPLALFDSEKEYYREPVYYDFDKHTSAATVQSGPVDPSDIAVFAAHGLTFDEAEYRRRLNAVAKNVAACRALLSAIQPKCVASFYYPWPIAGAMAIACTEMGIPTIDFQHGRLGPYNIMYTDFFRVPGRGFTMQPDQIWCWSEETRDDVLRNRPTNMTKLAPWVGGDASLGRAVHLGGLRGDPELEKALERFTKGRKVALFCLQPMENSFSSEILKAIKLSAKDWVWLIRCHPLQGYRPEQIERILDAENIDNAQSVIATSLPLYSILPRINHHVTYWSSVCLQALQFGIRSTVISDIGAKVFSKWVENGAFKVCYTGAEIAASLSAEKYDGDTFGLRAASQEGLSTWYKNLTN